MLSLFLPSLSRPHRLQGARFIEWLETSEWRQKLRAEAHARSQSDKAEEDKAAAKKSAEERAAIREGTASTKKVSKPKKVD